MAQNIFNDIQKGRVDVHVHLGGGIDSPGGLQSLEERKEYNRVYNIKQSIILPSPEGCEALLNQGAIPEGLISNREAMEISKSNPGEFFWFYNIVPDAGVELEGAISRAKADGARGVGEFMGLLPFDDAAMDMLFTLCGKYELPFLFHMAPEKDKSLYGVIDGPGMPGLEEALKRHPDTVFIGHSQPVWFEISAWEKAPTPTERNFFPQGKIKEGELVRLLRAYSNLYLDLSANSAANALLRDPDYAPGFLEEFSERLMFGTDALSLSHNLITAPFIDTLVLSRRISKTAYENIMRKTAQRLLKL